MRPTRRFASPLPTATAVVVAVLVAMASTLADAGVGQVYDRELPTGRVTSSLVVSSRALATALASVAERLEEDWSGARRAHATTGAGLGLPLARRDRDHAFRPDLTRDRRTVASSVEIPTLDARKATHRRLLNLPPPTLA